MEQKHPMAQMYILVNEHENIAKNFYQNYHVKISRAS